MSKRFGLTLREAPADVEVKSHQLLLRAGFIRPLAAGIFSYLPLAKRSITKIENIMREEINGIGGQEMTMPVVHPADIWKETKRWYEIGTEMGRFYDKNERDMVLAMTHEEVVADLIRREIQSYRQLPQLVYHIQTKWRDDPRPRAGLIRVREFTMLDSYSLDANEASLDEQYRAHYQAYFNIFHRAGIKAIAVASDVGMMGGSMAHEYMYLTPIGEDTLVLCDGCGYHANRQIATFKKKDAAAETALPAEKVATPDVSTIEALAEFLGVPKAKTAKAVFMVATMREAGTETQKLIFAIVRGDMEVNETKLTNALKAHELRPAHPEEISSIGAVAGYASPVGLRSNKNVIIIVDDAVPTSPNLVAGANEAGYHLRNVNYGRDYQADVVADIAAAQEGDGCPRCGQPIYLSRGVEVGNIFKLGTKYTEALGGTFVDEDGSSKPVIMGSYGIGVGRLLACSAEENHDDKGLMLPITIAPYHVHLVGMGKMEKEADQVYEQLAAASLEVLYDDRDESAGVKFNDADLIGLPIRLTVGARAWKEGGVEMKLRHSDERIIIPLDNLVNTVQAQIDALFAEVQATVVPVPFEE
ncbi:MAG: proline--tRNA ligase [Anaerolineae bacterium]|nr:proline--tRNA ligase [Anaerolineae bacterium]